MADIIELPVNTLPKILVVDDMPANLMAMRVVLQDLQAEVITAESANLGLSLALEPNVALILLDINMPGMDGYEAAQLLHQTRETSDIPIIFLTAFPQSEKSREQAYHCGAIDYIEKPIDANVLLSKVQVYLSLWRLRFGIKEEVERRICAEKKVSFLSRYDSLTQLPNRLQLHRELEQLIQQSHRADKQFALLFLDLDGFKKINEEFGREAGDAFLIEIANRLQQHIRNLDILARYGSDEFIVLLPDLNDSSALMSKLEQLCDKANQALVLNGSQLKAGISIGVAVYPEHGEDADSLISHADTAMNAAKSCRDKDYQFYSQELSQVLKRRHLLEHYLRDAMKNDQLQLYYQPIVDVATGMPVCAEVLLRWFNDELGCVSPAEFIPVAENTGLIQEIGLWVLEQTLLAIHQRDGVHYAINASALQFNNDALVSMLRDRIDAGEVKPEQLIVEITEGLLLENTPEVTEQLYAIRDMGIDLSIDDFGTGYSALGYLKRCPVNKLKIDRSFISGIPADHDDLVLVNAIIAMAHALGLTVVAEGVETKEQWQTLQQLGCDMAQGFYFAKPLPQVDFFDYLDQLSAD